MHQAKLLVSGLFLTAALAVSGPIAAAAQEEHIQVRVYDSHHRDYHNWDDREDRAYRNYQQERHEPPRRVCCVRAPEAQLPAALLELAP